jgi:hypothetical protein
LRKQHTHDKLNHRKKSFLYKKYVSKKREKKTL